MGLQEIANVFTQVQRHPGDYVGISSEFAQTLDRALDHSIEKVAFIVLEAIQQAKIESLQDVQALRSIKDGLEHIQKRHSLKQLGSGIRTMFLEVLGFEDAHFVRKNALSEVMTATCQKIEERDLFEKMCAVQNDIIWHVEHSLLPRKKDSIQDLFHSLNKRFLAIKLKVEPFSEKILRLFELIDESIERCFSLLQEAQNETVKKQLISKDLTKRVKDFEKRIFCQSNARIGLQKQRVTQSAFEEVFVKLVCETKKVHAQTALFNRLLERRKMAVHYTKSLSTKGQEYLPELDPKWNGYTARALYGENGVCLGACIEIAALRLCDPTSQATIQPSAKARFLEAAHLSRLSTGQLLLANDFFQSLRNRIQLALASLKSEKAVELCYYLYTFILQIWELIWSMENKAPFAEEVLVDLKMKPYIDSMFLKKNGVYLASTNEHVGKTLDEFLENFESNITKLDTAKSPHFILSLTHYDDEEKTKKAAQEQIEAIKNSKLATHVYKQLASVANLQESDQISPKARLAALERLSQDVRRSSLDLFTNDKRCALIEEIAKARVGIVAPEIILQQVKRRVEEELKIILTDFVREEGGPLDIEEFSPSGHAVYLNLSAPYELQDVNMPGFTGMKTNDLDEFKLFLIFWACLNPYAKIDHLLQVIKD